MTKKYDRVFVHPKFKKKLKQEALDRDTSVFKLTETLASECDPFETVFKKNEKKSVFKNFRL